MRRRVLLNAVRIGIGLLAGLILIEIGLRMIGFSRPLFYRHDDYVGVTLMPGASGWYRDEGEAWVSISSDGLRDREHRHEKDPDVFRIAVLGDSYAEAIQVPMGDTFWSILERALSTTCAAVAGRRIEVINLGVSGYGTAQELLTLERRVKSFAPDYVLLAFFSGNDMRENYRPLRKDPTSPYFVFGGDQLVADLSFRGDPGYQRGLRWTARVFHALVNHSRVFQVVQKAIDRARGRGMGEPVTGEAGLDNEIYSEPVSPEWREAWRVTEALLIRTRDEAKAMGARFGIITLSTSSQVDPDPVARRSYARRLGVPDLFYAERRLKALADREGIAELNLAPLLQRDAEENHLYLHGFANTKLGFGHWNRDGHRLAGKHVSEWLCGELAHSEPHRDQGLR
jgi:hypothetical protein